MTKKEEKKTPIVLQETEMQKKVDEWFEPYLGIVKKHEKSANIEVNSDDTMKRAEQAIIDIKEDIEKVEKVKTTYARPVHRFHRMITSKYALLTDPLQSITKRINKRIAAYKAVQAAMLKRQQEEKMQAMDEVSEEQAKEGELVSRLEKKCNAMIYGGQYTNKEGKTERFGPITGYTHSDIEKVKKVINENLPPENKFKHFSENFLDVKADLVKRIGEVESLIIELNDAKTSDKRKSSIAGDIADKHANALHQTIRREEHMMDLIYKKRVETREETAGEIRSYKKGLREMVKHTCQDISKVPDEYIIVDDRKVADFAQANGKYIKEQIQKGNADEIIPGIHFYVETQNVTRR